MGTQRFALGCLLMLAAGVTVAGDWTDEPVASVYWQIPFARDAMSRREQYWGLQLSQTSRDRLGDMVSSFDSPHRPPVVNFRIGRKGLDGLYVYGVNTLTPAVFNMAEKDSSVWLVVGGSVAAAVALSLSASGGGVSTSRQGHPQVGTVFDD